MWIPKYCKFDDFYGKNTIIEEESGVINEGILHKIYKSKSNEWGVILHIKKNIMDKVFISSLTITAALIKNIKILCIERKEPIQKIISKLILSDISSIILEFDDDYIYI
jgi:hypothetical protein